MTKLERYRKRNKDKSEEDNHLLWPWVGRRWERAMLTLFNITQTSRLHVSAKSPASAAYASVHTRLFKKKLSVKNDTSSPKGSSCYEQRSSFNVYGSTCFSSLTRQPTSFLVIHLYEEFNNPSWPGWPPKCVIIGFERASGSGECGRPPRFSWQAVSDACRLTLTDWLRLWEMTKGCESCATVCVSACVKSPDVSCVWLTGHSSIKAARHHTC